MFEKATPTAVNNIVLVAIIQCTTNLPCEFACHPFPEPSVADDIIKHLTAVDIFEDHVVMMLVNNHFAHSADVWVVEEHREGSLAEGADFLGSILGSLLCSRLGRACLLRSTAGIDTG